MVIILSTRKSKNEKEIIKILKSYQINYISDKIIHENNGRFTIASIYKKIELNIEKAIAIFPEKTIKFKDQKFPIGIVGVCEEKNNFGLEVFKKNRNAVITCGSSNKNTITLSSYGNCSILATLQRSFYDINGNKIEPCEMKINLTDNYSPLSIMCAALILLYHGITPTTF